MKQAVLVVDMLNDFVHPDGALCVAAAPMILPVVTEAVKAHRAKGDLIIYVCDRHATDDAEFQMFPPHAIKGTKGADIVCELAPLPGDILVPKRRYSGFFGTGLDLALREKGVTSLVLVGVCTNICVLYTAADARNLGYEVTVYADAVAGLSDKAHDWALQEMRTTLGCRVMDTFTE